MEKTFLNKDQVENFLMDLFTNCIDNSADYEDEIEDYAHFTAQSICDDMKRYVHMESTRMDGNFADISADWNYIPDFVDSEIRPWGNFDDIVKSIDDGTISDDDLENFQQWAFDWFLTAFGTWGLCYNFQTLIGDLEYEREEYAD